ncbi:UNKNOWN [Stylonychia lemnae]|uniref:Uncharacterized protein n=1 Tax=Stylonychia lemnae TaxID=5949 RepID=A0A078B355_STYLE|nr:UNKNOWN [Stylonychia lemnae]|eukprot:CDW88950.1 UNKNOWN [Stylonychia lemnae]
MIEINDILLSVQSSFKHVLSEIHRIVKLFTGDVIQNYWKEFKIGVKLFQQQNDEFMVVTLAIIDLSQKVEIDCDPFLYKIQKAKYMIMKLENFEQFSTIIELQQIPNKNDIAANEAEEDDYDESSQERE